MNVLILTQYFWPESFRINELAVELVARGHNVTVLTGLPNYPGGEIFTAFRADRAAFSRLEGVEIVRVPLVSRGKGRLRLALNYLSFAVAASTIGLWKVRDRRFDTMLIFQISPATIGLPAVVLRAVRRARLVFWVQDLWPDTLRAMGILRSSLPIWLLEKFQRWVYRHADMVLVQSRALLPRTREQAGPGLPLEYVPNWSPPMPAATSGKKSSDRFCVYYLGNIGKAQDFPAILAAAAKLVDRKEVEWHFVGDGSEVAAVRELIAGYGLSEQVHLHARVAPDELAPYLQDADCLLVPLKRDPLFELTVPSKLQSSLEAGLPLIAMLDGEPARIVAEAGAGIVVPAGHADALANAILELRAMPHGARAALGEAGRAYSQRHFHFPSLVSSIETALAGTPERRR